MTHWGLPQGAHTSTYASLTVRWAGKTGRLLFTDEETETLRGAGLIQSHGQSRPKAGGLILCRRVKNIEDKRLNGRKKQVAKQYV